MSRIYSLLPCLAALALGGFCLFGPSLQAAPVINYAGQVAVDGDPFDGQGQFKFALVNADGNQTYWSNDGTSSGGSEPQTAVGAQVNGGLYSLLLGNTAIQNMAALDPSVFQAHPDVHLRVWFSDGVNGFQHLAPDRPFASVPYAFSAGSAPIQAGSITLDKLGPDVLADLNRTIARGDLPADVLDDLNASVTLDKLSPDVLAALQILPSVSTQPFARYDRNTGSAQIEVTGRGHNLSYQWLKDGQPVNGATAPVLQIAGAVLDDNATYAVRITNSLGEATSQAVTLQNAVGAPGPPLAEANATEVPRAGLVLWLDAKDLDADGIADNLPDGTQIQTWADKSGNDRNATQDSLVNRPYVDNFFGNDNPTLRFAGSQLLVTPDANVSVAEFYMVFSATGVNQQYMNLLISSVGTKPRIRIKGNQVNQYNLGRNPTLNGTDRIGLEAYDQIHVLKLFPTSTSNTYFEDMILGATSETGGEFLTGSISEVILYDRRLDDNESANLINHLKSKWSIQPSSEPNSADDLFLHWKFEPETDSYYGVFDHSGNARGAYVTMDADRFVDGVDGKAFHFKGTSDSISLPSLAGISTLSMWVNTELDPTTGQVPSMAMLTLGNVSSPKRIIWGGTEGAVVTAYDNSGNYQEIRSSNVEGFRPGWNHWVIVIPNGQTFADIYLNGIKQPTTNVGTGFTSFNCAYGNVGRYDPISFFQGALDEFRLYTRALSEAEIQSLYNAVQTPIVRTDGEHNATVGSAFSLSLAVDNTPTTYLAEGLPAGLSLNVTTGEITGTVSEPGYHRIFVKAMNEHGTGSDVIAIVARPATDALGWPVDVLDGSDIPQNGMVLWLDANDVDADGVFDSGTDHLKLANWADKAGHDNNATQATVFRQPTIRGDQLTAKPNLNLLVFDGNQSLAFPTISQGRTFFWVINRGSAFNNAANFIRLNDSSEWGNNNAARIYNGSSTNIRNGMQRRDGENINFMDASTFLATLQVISLRTIDFQPANDIGRSHTDYFTGNIGEMLIYDRALTDPEIETVEQYLGQKWGIALAGDANASGVDLTSGLMAHLPFDETTGTVANDLSGNERHGSLIAGPTWVEGKIGGALSFDGVDDYVDLGNYEFGGAHSISAWVKYNSFNQWSMIYRSIDGSGSNHITLANKSSTATISYEIKYPTHPNPTDWYRRDDNFWLLDQWVHVVATLGTDEVAKIYRDGEFWTVDNNVTLQAVNLRTDQSIGKPTFQYFDGLIDDFRIYDRALTADEAKALYDLGSNPLATTTYASPNPSLTLTPANGSVTTAQLSEQILKYLKPEITAVTQSLTASSGSAVTLTAAAEGKYLSYQWRRNGQELVGETNASLVISDANGTVVDGNYSVVVSNDFGSVTGGLSQAVVETSMKAVPGAIYLINNSNGSAGHQVAISPYSIDSREITKGLWDSIRAWALQNGYNFSNPGLGHSSEHPVHSVSWYDCVKWANALSEHEGLTPCYYTDGNRTQIYRTGEMDLTNYMVNWTANGYRLPTEAEWEVAARGLLVGAKYAWGETASTTKANYDQSLIGKTTPVGTYASTGYGLHDIGGNLREWVWDWKDDRTYAYDFKETFPDANGTLDLVSESNTTSAFDLGSESYQHFMGNPTEVSTSSYAEYQKVKTLVLHKPSLVQSVTNQIKNSQYNTRCKIKFYYSDGSSSESSYQESTSSWASKEYTNSSPAKLVTKVEVLLATWADFRTAYEKNTIVVFARPEAHSSITFMLSEHSGSFSTHFRLKIEADREGDDDIWFELVDESNATKTYANANFDQLLAIEDPIVRPNKLRIHLKPATNPTVGGTALKAVYWTTNDPKSWPSGTHRVVRDNHFAEDLQFLSHRNLSTPSTATGTIGFRLVRRPSDN